MHSGPGQDQVAVGGIVPRFHFGPRFLFAKIVSVVTPENDNGVIALRAGLERVEEAEVGGVR